MTLLFVLPSKEWPQIPTTQVDKRLFKVIVSQIHLWKSRRWSILIELLFLQQFFCKEFVICWDNPSKRNTTWCLFKRSLFWKLLTPWTIVRSFVQIKYPKKAKQYEEGTRKGTRVNQGTISKTKDTSFRSLVIFTESLRQQTLCLSVLVLICRNSSNRRTTTSTGKIEKRTESLGDHVRKEETRNTTFLMRMNLENEIATREISNE
jgi:hypothetical protein